MESDLHNAIHAAADKAMPLRSTVNYAYKDLW